MMPAVMYVWSHLLAATATGQTRVRHAVQTGQFISTGTGIRYTEQKNTAKIAELWGKKTVNLHRYQTLESKETFLHIVEGL